MKWKVPFNEPYFNGKELKFIKQAAVKHKLLGNGGVFTRKCEYRLSKLIPGKKLFLTNSATAALEMSALLLNIKEEDEIILPSFTYISTANAFMLRGAKPVFIDIKESTFNIDEKLIEEKITEKTKAIIPVHYGGVSANMTKIIKIGKTHKIPVIEDAAQGIDSYFKGKHLGTFGDLGVISFHETKNIHCGNGGLLIINKEKYIKHADILFERGTDKIQFLKGEKDFYSWIGIAGSYALSELNAAFLSAQLDDLRIVKEKRRDIYLYYLNNLKGLEEEGILKLPHIPKDRASNYHIFSILVENQEIREHLIEFLKQNGIEAVFHYFPLHLSRMGKKLGYKKGQLPITEEVSQRLIRLPLFFNYTVKQQDYVIKKIKEFFGK